MSPETALALQRTMGNAAVSRLISEEEPVQAEAPVQRSAVQSVLSSPGAPLADSVRADMEARLGADFSGVRLHTGPAARDSAAEIGARAYTSGDHVVIGDGGADTHTLAHELTHVIQQRQGPVAGTDNGSGLSISDPSDRFEREAEANAHRALSGPAPVQRAPEDPEVPEETSGGVRGSLQVNRAPAALPSGGSSETSEDKASPEAIGTASGSQIDRHPEVVVKGEENIKAAAIKAAALDHSKKPNPDYGPLGGEGELVDPGRATWARAFLPTGKKGEEPKVTFTGAEKLGLDRAHLLANRFGGHGRQENIVLFGRDANTGKMNSEEGKAAAAAQKIRNEWSKNHATDKDVAEADKKRKEIDDVRKKARDRIAELEKQSFPIEEKVSNRYLESDSRIYYNVEADYGTAFAKGSVANYVPDKIVITWGRVDGVHPDYSIAEDGVKGDSITSKQAASVRKRKRNEGHREGASEEMEIDGG